MRCVSFAKGEQRGLGLSFNNCIFNDLNISAKIDNMFIYNTFSKLYLENGIYYFENSELKKKTFKDALEYSELYKKLNEEYYNPDEIKEQLEDVNFDINKFIHLVQLYELNEIENDEVNNYINKCRYNLIYLQCKTLIEISQIFCLKNTFLPNLQSDIELKMNESKFTINNFNYI